ncbi:MAG: pseudouridine synthase [Planctomycetota bacterium]
MNKLQRLQKYLAYAGIASRRKCEILIQEKRVQVNRIVVTSLGTKIDPDKDEIRCDGEVVRPEKKIYILLNKPKGFVCSARPQGGKNIFSLVKGISQRIYTVGRLDKDSEGLILLTNDGGFADKCTHPKFGLTKTYRVAASGEITANLKKALSKGIYTSDGRITIENMRIIKKHRDFTELEIVLREGKNRHIRRALEALKIDVKKLTRISLGNLHMGNLPKGSCRKLSEREIDSLLKE